MDITQSQYCYKYPHPAVTTDCCIFAFLNNELSILLIRRGIDPYKGEWALPGGFMKMTETADECARRELFEETGYFADSLHQFGAYTEIDRDPRERVVSIAYYALVKMASVRGGDDADDARWFPVSQLPLLAFDHLSIVNDALMAMRRDIYFEPIGFELLPPTFTMAELQKIVETITGQTFDRRNFYNKMRHLQFVSEVNDDMSRKRYELMPKAEKEDNQENSDWRRRYRHYYGEDYPQSAKKSAVRASVMTSSSPENCDTDETVEPPRTRRSGVKYFFNKLAFQARKDKKGNGPITF